MFLDSFNVFFLARRFVPSIYIYNIWRRQCRTHGFDCCVVSSTTTVLEHLHPWSSGLHWSGLIRSIKWGRPQQRPTQASVKYNGCFLKDIKTFRRGANFILSLCVLWKIFKMIHPPVLILSSFPIHTWGFLNSVPVRGPCLPRRAATFFSHRKTAGR